MSGVSDYAQRIEYVRSRYWADPKKWNERGRAYRARNREAIKIARGLGVGVAEARAKLSAISNRSDGHA